jgi:hypothetical protein
MNFFTDISLWWVVPMATFAFLLSGWYYFFRAENSGIPPKAKWILAGFRGSVFFLILLLLIGIVIHAIKYRSEKPILTVLVDQSESMLNYGDSASVRKELPEFLQRLSARVSDKYDVKIMGFSGEVKDSVDFRFSGKLTDISIALKQVRETFYQRNLGAVLLVSDGNFNQGVHPHFELERFNYTPIYALAVGDTMTKKDASIVSVTANQIAFSGNVFPVVVECAATKLKGKKVTVSVLAGGKLLEERQVVIKEERAFFSETFQLKATGKGIQTYTLLIKSDVKEYTLANNSRTIYVEVLESKRKVLIASGGIHPDVGALQSTLQKDKNTEVEFLFFKDIREIPKVDLIIIHNPVSPFLPNLWEDFKNSGIPLFIILGAGGESQQLSQLNLGLSGVSAGQFDAVYPIYSSQFNTIEFSEELKKRMGEFPPLSVPFVRNYATMGSALLFQRVGSVTTNRPLLSVVERGGRKFAVLYGEGIWRWKLNEYNRYQTNAGFEELWDKLLQYLTVKQNTDKLRVFPPVSLSDNAHAVFRAEFYNDAFQLITDPDVSFELYDDQSNKLAGYTFSKRQSDYQLNLGVLENGVYRWKAYATHLGKRFEKTGDLIVSELSFERMTLTSNFNVLNDLAAMHNGQFMQWFKKEHVLKSLLEREDIQTMRFEESAFGNLLDYKWILFLLVSLLVAEWTIRRWFGLI